jgi:hypothetical protein
VLIVIDLSESRIHLNGPDDFTRFSVEVAGDGDIGPIVRTSGLGRISDGGDQVAVDPAAVRALAGPAATEAWEEGFAGMCTYAAGKGWVDPEGGIRAHIERRIESV